MAILRKLARPLLASPFVTGGLRTLRRPEAVAERARPVVGPIAERIPALAGDPVTLVRATGAVQAGAGLLLATGRAPRLAALTLAATLVPSTVAGHAFWTMEDPQERARHRAAFLKDLALVGGLLIAAADTHGKPSLAYRSRHALDHAHPLRAVSGPVAAAATSTAARARAAAQPLVGRL
ncbi:DoxX family protein [Streptomyces subrutilus]|uniref:DoxX family protein n=1 Tax=Streptomyces subrutilus TaxID=36818 RepID=UPI002E136662|nr:DoxX family protein [Streptomyces subrutilus]